MNTTTPYATFGVLAANIEEYTGSSDGTGFVLLVLVVGIVLLVLNKGT